MNFVEEENEVRRVSISQRHMGSFPIMMYNIGLQKIVIQLFIGQGNQMIYEIPPTERFVNFIDFNTFHDIGFCPNGLRIEACSKVAFLTYDKQYKRRFVNLILIDPFFDDVQMSLF